MIRLRLLSLCALAAAAPVTARADHAAASEVAALRAELEAQRERLEALEANDDREQVEDHDDPALRIYGFMDLGLQKMFVEESSLSTAILQSDSTTFVLGNVNLYFDAQPVPGWRGLVEVRLTNAPNGADEPGIPGVPYQRTSTDILDPTSSNGGWAQIRWGALVLERAHLDWRHSDYLNLRAGVFLTPAGIWNVDHGSPTLIALQAPQFLVIEMFPPRQTGLQLFGTHHFAPWALDYVVYVSNGRVAQQLDPTEDKAFGGRFVLRRNGKTRLALGTSFYVNRFSDQTREIQSLEPYSSTRTEITAFNEQSVGIDASLDVGPLRLRAEGALRHVIYDEGKRSYWFGYPGFYLSDRNEVDAYVLAAYQLPWLGLEPFVNFEFQRAPSLLSEGEAIPSAGFNLHFTAATTLKVQVAHTIFWGEWVRAGTNVTFAAARAVLAF